jgi:hypothetical protein
MEAITSFYRRSAFSLLSFTVILSISPLARCFDFMNLLESMPSLNTLSIISTTATTMYFKNVTPEDYNPRNILQLVTKVLSSQSASLQQGFLPNLKTLEYTGKLNLRPEDFDDLYSLPPADITVHCPLHLFRLNLHRVTHLPDNMISVLSSLVERGVTVDVLARSEDILQPSIDFYRRKRDSFHGDWTDNFESSFFS